MFLTSRLLWMKFSIWNSQPYTCWMFSFELGTSPLLFIYIYKILLYIYIYIYIQVEVNFFERFDKNYKPQILNNRTTKNLLQKENKATHMEPRSIITNHRFMSYDYKY
jgi:hypothetical protein